MDGRPNSNESKTELIISQDKESSSDCAEWKERNKKTDQNFVPDHSVLEEKQIFRNCQDFRLLQNAMLNGTILSIFNEVSSQKTKI